MKYIKNSDIEGTIGGGIYGYFLSGSDYRLLGVLFLIGLGLILAGGLILGGKTCRTDFNLQSVKCKVGKWLLWSGYSTIAFPLVVFFGPEMITILRPLLVS
jgi:hypothetical protein